MPTLNQIGNRAKRNSKSISELAAKAKALTGDISEAINISPLIAVIGDSTGNDTTEWPYLLAQRIAARNPTFNVKHKLFNVATGLYGAWTDVQHVGEDRHLYIPAYDAGTWVGSGYYADADVTKTSADLDISLQLAADDWQQGGNRYFFSKYGSTSHLCFSVRLLSGSSVRFYWYPTGATESQIEFNTGINTAAFTDGDAKWLRITLDVDNGAGGYTITSYTSTNGVTWTQAATYTGASTTSIFTDSSVKYSIGSTATNEPPISGKYFEIIMRDGIGGPIINTQPIDSCMLPIEKSPHISGTPTIYIYNASIPGSKVDSWIVESYFNQAVPPMLGATVFINLGHNDGAERNAAYLAKYNTLLGLIHTRIPGANVILLTQNPILATTAKGDNNKVTRSVRRRQLMGWAKKNGVDVIDTYAAFVNSGQALTSLINTTDGIHPTEAGSVLEANEIASKVYQ